MNLNIYETVWDPLVRGHEYHTHPTGLLSQLFITEPIKYK